MRRIVFFGLAAAWFVLSDDCLPRGHAGTALFLLVSVILLVLGARVYGQR